MNRQLAALRFDPPGPDGVAPAPGWVLLDGGGAEVGEVTSVAGGADGAALGLGFVRRGGAPSKTVPRDAEIPLPLGVEIRQSAFTTQET